jgi:hypothetical protein
VDHVHEAGVAACELARDIDQQIMAMWKALRTNPSLDARWAMQVIDRLLDKRSGQMTLSGPPGTAARNPGPALPAQQAILASVMRAVLTGEPG